MDGVVLTAEAVRSLEPEPLGRVEGVAHRPLWSEGGSHAGLLTMEPDVRMPEHTHDHHGHHIWVVSGGVSIRGETIGPGGYAYVPGGEPHGLASGSDGAELFYLNLVT